MGLLSELSRRNVLRMAALYIVAAWLIMQVAEVLVTLAALPPWAGRAVLALLAIGLPVALVLSWFYELTPEGISLDADDESTEKAINHASGRRLDFIVISLLSAAVILFAWHTWWPDGERHAPHQPIESIAVLPLQNLSNDPNQKYFVEGMQDALITRLSRTTDLRVISKTSTLRYEESDTTIPDIARELNVDAVVEGSVLRDSDRVRITAKLIRGADDEHVWANSYDRDLEHVFTLINEISMAIADEIEVTVRQQDIRDGSPPRPVDMRVHELVLQGHHHFDRFMFDESLRLFQQAAELDPDFAPAHGGVAASWLLKEVLDWRPDSGFVPKARAAALKAIDLDRNSAVGYSTLGTIQLYIDWDWESARANLQRALELSPNDSRTRHAYADYLMVMGELEESLGQVEIGALYDPLSPIARIPVEFHKILTRRYDEVIDKAREAIAAEPDRVTSAIYFREALWLKGLHDEAYEVYKRTWGKDKTLLDAMNSGFSEGGYTGAIGSLADALAARDPEYSDYVTLASLYARAGDSNRALEYLDRAYRHRQPQILHVKAMPVFDELRSDPGFQDLLRRIGFPEDS